MRNQHAIAERYAHRAVAVALTADYLLQTNRELGTLLAVKAAELTHDRGEKVVPNADATLRKAVRATFPRLSLPPQTKELYDAALSPDMTRLATAGGDRTLSIWDAESGAKVLSCEGHERPITSLAFRRSDLVLTGSQDSTARLWDISGATCAAVGDVMRHNDYVLGVAFSPDGKLAATASRDGTAKLWPLGAGEPMVLSGHEGKVHSIAFDPTGSRVATASTDGTVRVWSVASGEQILLLRGHSSDVFSVAFSRDGEHIVSGSRDTTARVWNAHTGELERVLRGNDDGVFAVAFNPVESPIVATAAADGRVMLWDWSARKPLRLLAASSQWVRGLTFSRTGDVLVTSGGDKTARIWDMKAFNPLLQGHTNSVTALAYDRKGQSIVTASADGTLKLWEVSSGKALGTASGGGKAFNDIGFLDQDRLLATVSDDHTVRILDARTGKTNAILEGHLARVTSVVELERPFALTGSEDGTIAIWDYLEAKRINQIIAHDGDAVLALAVHPNRRSFATGSFNGTVKLWSLRGGMAPDLTATHTLRGHTMPVLALAYSEDGKTLASGGTDRAIRMWDIASGTAQASWIAHQGEVTGLAFEPIEGKLVSVGTDAILNLWDLGARHPRNIAIKVDGKLKGVAVRGDGRQVAVARYDALAELIDLPRDVEELIRIAKARVPRSLTPEECECYVGGEEC